MEGCKVAIAMLNKHTLEEQIKLKKQDMYAKARMLGFTHPAVVACSQELDRLLNRYQKLQST